MKPNVGATDKLIRYAIGVVLISLHLSGTLTGGLGAIIVVLAVALLITAIIKFCPIYHVLGNSTWDGEPKPPGKY
jgi:hypothetical protein